MSTTTSYRTITRRAWTILLALAAAAALVLLTGCTAPQVDAEPRPAPSPKIPLDEVNPRDDAAVEAWTKYLQVEGEDELRELVPKITKWSMSPADCRSRVSGAIVDSATNVGYQEDDTHTRIAILIAMNEARCWEKKDYDLPGE